MKVIVIGCGLIGVTTAYALRCRGHEVTVIDRQGGPGRETSFANGALLTSSMSQPWNSPGCWRTLVGSLWQSDGALQWRLKALPSLARWGLTFLRNSSAARFERNALNSLRFATYSLEVLASWRAQTRLEFGHVACGTLRVFRDEAALVRAAAAADALSWRGLRSRRLSRPELIAIEPALTPVADRLCGGIHYESDEVADAYRFCVALTEHARRQGVEFRFDTEITALELRSRHLTAALSGAERFVADRYIVAAGSFSAPLLHSIGLKLPVRPAKGYSLTFDPAPAPTALRLPVVDDQLHAAVVPLENAIRVAGTAEFAGFDRSVSPDRTRSLLRLLKEVLPQERFDAAGAKAWCGLRPMSADGVPIIGPTPVENLLVNTGHGHLGWTMAAGSAQLLAHLIGAEPPGIDPAPFAFARFY